MSTSTRFVRFDPKARRAAAMQRASNLGIAASAAAAGFALVARAVARRQTLPADVETQQKATPEPGHPSRRVASAIAPVGKWYTYVPASVAMAAWLRWRGPRRGRTRREHDAAGIAIVLASLLSFGLTRLFDRVLPQPPAPPGHEDPHKPVFPSGHAFGTMAVGLTAAYSLSRSSVVAPGRAFLSALAIPVVSAGGRFVEERHWPTDIVGGALGGLAVAGLAAAVFELTAE
jgi:membrane-associated phospholipid phosphatase